MNGHAPPAGTRTPGHAAGASLLGLLLGATATALGVLVSWWLVPPYLLGMVWLLLPEGQAAEWRRRLQVRRPAREAIAPGPRSQADNLDRPARRPEPDPAGVDAEPAPAAVAVAPPRRKRAPRKPKVAPVAAEPVAATWVQVGPGRFVRVEVTGTPAEPTVAPEPDPVSTPDASDAAPLADPPEAPGGWGLGPAQDLSSPDGSETGLPEAGSPSHSDSDTAVVPLGGWGLGSVGDSGLTQDPGDPTEGCADGNPIQTEAESSAWPGDSTVLADPADPRSMDESAPTGEAAVAPTGPLEDIDSPSLVQEPTVWDEVSEPEVRVEAEAQSEDGDDAWHDEEGPYDEPDREDDYDDWEDEADGEGQRPGAW